MWVTGGTVFQTGWAAKMSRPQGRSGALAAFQKPAGAQSEYQEMSPEVPWDRVTQGIIGTLAFTLNEMGSHCMVLR